MNLPAAIDLYVTAKRALGAVFSAERRVLRSFARRVGDLPVADITAQMCESFCRGSDPPTQFWVRKHYTLHAFFRYLRGRGEIAVVPLPATGPRVAPTFQPYIYSVDELRRLLDATAALATPRAHVAPDTWRMLLLVLYAAGLRAGEGLRLQCDDVDLPGQVLTIWDTKFFKSRLVPIGTQLCQALDRYAGQRGRPPSASVRAPFFRTTTEQPISLAQLEAAFVRLRTYAGIERPATDRWQPRLHDMRHSFAVHQLISWYRAGVDVQTRLPLLATYLGHVNLAGTQKYLTMTPELLGEAARRFERYADATMEVPHD